MRIEAGRVLGPGHLEFGRADGRRRGAAEEGGEGEAGYETLRQSLRHFSSPCVALAGSFPARAGRILRRGFAPRLGNRPPQEAVSALERGAGRVDV